MQESHPGDDFIITKCFVKSLLALNVAQDSALLVFEQFELKPILDQAREYNKKLVEKHSYSKIEADLDQFELNLCNYYLTNDEFGRLSRKYLSKTTAPHLQVTTRYHIIGRMDVLSDTDAKDRHLRVLTDMLEAGDKYK